MKNPILLLFTLLVMSAGCQNDNSRNSGIETEDAAVMRVNAMPKTTIEFTNTKHDFGTIKEGDIVQYAYQFKNTGTHPLQIAKAVVSCGCTTPTLPKDPIPPGGSSEIVVQFNSKHKQGKNDKNILIYSNAQEEKMSLGFTADVTKD